MGKSAESHTYNSNGIVKQRLSEYDDVENFIDMDLFKDGQDGHRVDGWDESREKERIQQGKFETVKAS